MGADVEQVELSYVAGGNVNGTATLKNRLAVAFSMKHILNHMTQQSQYWVFILKEKKKLIFTQNLEHECLFSITTPN